MTKPFSGDKAGDRFKDLALGSLLSTWGRFSPAHRGVLSYIRRHNDGLDLEIEEVVMAFGYLFHMIYRLAGQENLFEPLEHEIPEGGSGYDYSRVDESKFEHEIHIMRNLQTRMIYTNEFKAHLEGKIAVFAQSLRGSDAFHSGREKWSFLTLEERLAFIDFFFQSMMKAFSSRLFTYSFSSIGLFDDDGTLGTSNAEHTEIAINRGFLAGLKDDDQLLSTVLHEGIHNLITQLTLAHRYERLGNYPYAADVRLANMIKTYSAHARPFIYSLYQTDAEEQLCRFLEDRFEETLGREARLLSRRNFEIKQAMDAPFQPIKLKKPLSFVPAATVEDKKPSRD